MNLVAKEFVACQDDDDPGVLILSPFAGAGGIMQEALQVSHSFQVPAKALFPHLLSVLLSGEPLRDGQRGRRARPRPRDEHRRAEAEDEPGDQTNQVFSEL